ncbi:DUF805 domain-containing protein [Massilia pseudoviolaceinigra]|uniref:DUF805 domain-containing protein n=1 Tax=Massilia pseudoviolaceinigra TaxID=3057165 RepID=UPI002796AA8B|nr:DUF805 domain-containing protein [Massilia sp. CCM 9206]MDQ1919634.1 DUF805 domain-containing protein [Massilia sp. CCM 9206]
MNNPYAPPESDLTPVQEHSDTYPPTWFDARGRIGRLRYLVYATVPSTLAVLLVLFLIGWFDLRERPIVMPVLLIGTGVAVAAVLALMTLRRLRDLGQPGWWALILLLAPINVLLVGFLLVRPGGAGPNRYGPPPADNTTLVAAGTWIVLVMAFTGLFRLFDIG